MFLLGLYIFKGFKTFSDKDRIVTVKGLAVMNMKATSSSIGLNFSFSGDSLKQIIEQTENKKNKVIKYLNSIGHNNIEINNININDREQYYRM